MALDLAPIEVAQLFNSLANGGFRTPLRAVRVVIGADGAALKAFPLQVTPVADPAVVYQLNRMLTKVTQRGTGQAVYARLPPDVVVAGKTGTSSEFRDSWFAGFTGSHLAIVWVGYDDNRPTGLTGAGGALSIWANLMRRLPITSWDEPLPESLRETWIEYDTGTETRPTCSEDVVSIALPREVILPTKPGCLEGTFSDFTERAKQWLKGIIR